MVAIFLDTLVFGQMFLSLQVKQSEIINNNHGTCELPFKLQNDLRLGILGNQENVRKI